MGAENLEFVDAGTGYGKLETLSGRELEWVRQIAHLATHKMTVPHVPGMDTTWRVAWAGRTFEVSHINDRMMDGVEDEVILTELI